MKLLDLFCGAGGASRGYHRAGFEVTGVDIAPQPRYPFGFVQADALEYVTSHGHKYDVIAASPPCQSYSVTRRWSHGAPRLIPELRTILENSGKIFVIENVAGAVSEMNASLMLCGLMFGLKVFRHRYFESNVLLLGPLHPSHKGHRIGENGMCCVCGSGDANWNQGHHVSADHRTLATFNRAMDIDWMLKREITQAIPPAYTEFIGRQLMTVLTNRQEQEEQAA